MSWRVSEVHPVTWVLGIFYMVLVMNLAFEPMSLIRKILLLAPAFVLLFSVIGVEFVLIVSREGTEWRA